jgi:tRNA1Val (adenine37-N6)-methyltransferase
MHHKLGQGFYSTSNEAIDSIGPYVFVQSKKGQKTTSDTALLADFIRGVRPGDSIIELGSGAGALLLMLASKTRSRAITGVEIDKGSAALSKRNIAINGLDERVRVLNIDFRDIKAFCKRGSFSIVASNPPFSKVGSSRLSPLKERASARAEVSGALKDLTTATGHLLSGDGKAYYVFPALRLDEMIVSLNEAGLRPTRLRFIHRSKTGEGRVFLMEARRKGVLKVEAPVIFEGA